MEKNREEIFLEGPTETDEGLRRTLAEEVEAGYLAAGLGEELIERFREHNAQVAQLVERFAAAEGFTEKEQEIAVLAALLHDMAKGEGDFVSHAERGAVMARELLEEKGVSPELSLSVARAIERHMGEEGYTARAARLERGEEFSYPTPRTKVGELLYECDILTQLTPEGLKKIAALRAADAKLIAEDEAVAAEKGIAVEQARRLSALASAKESYEIIERQASWPLESVKRYARELWEQLSVDNSASSLHASGSSWNTAEEVYHANVRITYRQ